jgi:hypothetical protein
MKAGPPQQLSGALLLMRATLSHDNSTPETHGPASNTRGSPHGKMFGIPPKKKANTSYSDAGPCFAQPPNQKGSSRGNINPLWSPCKGCASKRTPRRRGASGPCPNTKYKHLCRFSPGRAVPVTATGTQTAFRDPAVNPASERGASLRTSQEPNRPPEPHQPSTINQEPFTNLH